MPFRPPSPRRRALRFAAGCRRGAAALTVVMAAAAVAAGTVLAWQATSARDRLSGTADLVAETAAHRAGALHHWLHAWQADPSFAMPGAGAARELPAAEAAALRAHGAWAPWLALPRSWNTSYLVANPRSQGGDPARAAAILVLSPPPVTGGGLFAAVMETLRDAVAVRLDGPGSGTEAETLADAALGTRFDPARDIAVFAWPFAGIDGTVALRERRTGLPAPVLETDLDMAGHAVACAPGAACGVSAGTVAARALDGNAAVERDLSAAALEPGTRLEIASPVDTGGAARAGSLDVDDSVLAVGTTTVAGATASGTLVANAGLGGAVPEPGLLSVAGTAILDSVNTHTDNRGGRLGSGVEVTGAALRLPQNHTATRVTLESARVTGSVTVTGRCIGC